MSRNQWDTAAAAQIARPAPNLLPQWRRETSNPSPKIATSRPRFAQATSCGSISQARQ
jgi:hypothetical protein